MGICENLVMKAGKVPQSFPAMQRNMTLYYNPRQHLNTDILLTESNYLESQIDPLW